MKTNIHEIAEHHKLTIFQAAIATGRLIVEMKDTKQHGVIVDSLFDSSYRDIISFEDGSEILATSDMFTYID